MRPRAAALALILVLAPARGAAQVPEPADTIPAPAPASLLPEALAPMTPRGAFIRSMILPGWGQSAFESYIRGGIYFAGWGANGYMVFRTVTRLDEARTRFDLRSAQLADALIAESPNPDSLRAVLDVTGVPPDVIQADSLGNALRMLVRAREEHREDWIAWTLFWILASGIDAYVTAHLADFPAEIRVDGMARGGVSLTVEVPLRRRRP